MQDGFGGPWSREDAARARRVRKMLRQMDRLGVPGAIPVVHQPRERGGPSGGRATRVLLFTAVLVVVALLRGPHLLAVGASQLGLLHRSGAPSSAYSLLAVQPGSRDFAVSYDGCQKLHYRVNLAGAPPADPAASFVFAAVRRVEKASGLDFVYDGPSQERPNWGKPLGGGPILIGFAEPREVSELQGDVVGVGGSARTTRGSLEEYVTGDVTLDQGAMARILQRPQGAAYAQAVVMHELGHVLGLGHVHDTSEIMNPAVHALDWGPGDLQGLTIVGHGPCF